MTGPTEGLTVYAPMLDVLGEVLQTKTGWNVLEIETGEVALRTEDLVVPSLHARKMWEERVSDPFDRDADEALASAWAAGSELDPEACGLDGDEVRHEPATGATMVLDNGCIVMAVGRDRHDRLERAIEEARG